VFEVVYDPITKSHYTSLLHGHLLLAVTSRQTARIPCLEYSTRLEPKIVKTCAERDGCRQIVPDGLVVAWAMAVVVPRSRPP
jgi:hypothetical protein